MSFGSFFAALSGLQANASRLSVIGNNLANINTIGFKSSRVTFHDFFAGSAFNGAGNPTQVGLGTSLASIDPIFNQGSLQTTNILTDMAIQGRGFFVLGNKQGGVSYARAGNFSFDQDGNLVSSGGHEIQGFSQKGPNGEILESGALSTIRVPTGLSAPPKATSNFKVSLQLDSRQTQDFASTLTVFDSLGAQHNLTINFTPGAATNSWDWSIAVDGDEVVGGTPGSPFTVTSGNVAFDGSGQLTSPATNVTFVIPGWNNGADPQTVEWELFDPNGDALLRGFSGESAVSSSNQNGYSVGEIRSLVIDQEGLISGIFSNGVVVDVAKIALATFNNENGLLRNGENTYISTNSSGSATVGVANTGGRGATVSGSLELSNVDITEEFTDLIISQRGYQANSRIITTSDEVIQESLNLKR